MNDYAALRYLLEAFFNPNWGLTVEEDMLALGRQLQVTEYVADLKNDFAKAYEDNQFSWLSLFAALRLDDAYGLHDEQAVRDWVRRYIWPEVFPGDSPLIREL